MRTPAHPGFSAVRTAALAAVAVFALLASGAKAQEASRAVRAVPDDFHLRLTRGGCEGSCPIFDVDVDARGRVLWTGRFFVRVRGKATRTITTQALQSLLDGSRRFRILSLSAGTHPCIDRPLVTLDLTESGRSISVGYCEGDITPESTRLLEFARQAEKVMADAAWLGDATDRRMR